MLNIPPEVLSLISAILKIVATVAVTIITWIAKSHLKNQKKMTSDIHDIRTEMKILVLRYDSMKEALDKGLGELKERIIQLEDVVYKR
jgi:hypothetical protein